MIKKNYTSEWIRVLFAIFFIFGIGATFYIFSKELKDEADKVKASNNAIKLVNPAKGSNAQKSILDSLNILKLEYEVAILEKTALSEQLAFEKKNVENLMEIIKASNNPSTIQIKIYRKQLSDLQTALASKVTEIKTLKSQNKNLLTEIETQNVVMYKQKAANDTLISNQKKLESTIKDASKLFLNNFKVVAMKEKKSGKEQETDKAKSADKLKISFSVNGNAIAKTGKRVFYIQVLDQKNTVLGENKLIEFGNDKALVYSFIVAADFQGKPLNVYGVLNSDGNQFKKGTYFVNFFDKQEIMGSASITLE
ncbi:hypothetical protein [Flavobacterium defluvii]|uniref:Cell division protein ZapB n=1 Tax=Flavobacterium defluvii TaxID=370979 RepID=A0A1M5G719_9FLAO|nr:hypothetical protein [Flavobacterium defluvii]SHF99252.1 hypothetical protein SAMN05443663_101730 [Flavobacterium defluvii]